MRRFLLFVVVTSLSTAAAGLVARVVDAAPPSRVAADARADASDAAPREAGPSIVAVEAVAPARIAPDPPALTERKQWVYDLRWDKGDVYLLEIQERDMGEPRTTPRVFGRFALELYEGPTLVERVRFDFPMLGGGADLEDAGSGGKSPPRLTAKLRTRIGVLFPATKRGTRLELWDRATDERYALPWPPTPGIVLPDGGAAR